MTHDKPDKPPEIEQTPTGVLNLLIRLIWDDAAEGSFLKAWACCAFGALLLPTQKILNAVWQAKNPPDSKVYFAMIALAVIAVFPVIIIRSRNLAKFVLIGLILSMILLYGVVERIAEKIMAVGRPSGAYAQDYTNSREGRIGDPLTVISPAPYSWDNSVKLDQLRLQGLAARMGSPARETPKGWVFRPPYRSAEWAQPDPNVTLALRAGELERTRKFRGNLMCIIGTAESRVTLQSMLTGDAIGIWRSIELAPAVEESDCDALNAIMAAISDAGRNQSNAELTAKAAIGSNARLKAATAQIFAPEAMRRLSQTETSRACRLLPALGITGSPTGC